MAQDRYDPIEALLGLHAFLRKRQGGMKADVHNDLKARIFALTKLAMRPQFTEAADPRSVLQLALELCAAGGVAPQEIVTIVNRHNTAHPELKS